MSPEEMHALRLMIREEVAVVKTDLGAEIAASEQRLKGIFAKELPPPNWISATKSRHQNRTFT